MSLSAILALLFIQGLRAEPTAPTKDLWLRIGEARSLPASPQAVIRIGKRNVVRVVENGASVHIVGLNVGVTPVMVDHSAYLIHVDRSTQKDFQARAIRAIGQMKGLRIVTDTTPIEVHGTLLRFSDWLKLAEIARLSHGEYRFKAQALSDAADEALVAFTNIVRNKGLPVLHFSAEPQFTVHIPAGDKALKMAAEDAFAQFGIRVQSSESQLMVQPLVRTQVVLAEVNRSRGRTFGIQWPNSYQARLVPKPETSDGVIATLKALESDGQAQILASPNLLCRSGGEAAFHAGGEFPVRVIARHARDIIWKRYGVLLNVKPRADFYGAMSVEIETEVSLLDMAHAVDGIPALKSNRVKSHFDLTGKRTIALSGLIKQERGRSAEGLPFLTGLPILGALFSSRQFQQEQSELVIFVTPEIQSTDADTPITLPRGWVTDDW